MFYDIYLYTLCYYICCLLGACMRCTRLCPLKPGVTLPPASSDDSDDSQGITAEVWTYIRAVERAGLEGSDESEYSSDEMNSSDSFEEGNGGDGGDDDDDGGDGDGGSGKGGDGSNKGGSGNGSSKGSNKASG
jgi:hypothetical protein